MQQFITPLSVPELLERGLKKSSLRNIVFTEEYPDERVTSPTIAWSIASRTLGIEGRERLKPRMRLQDVAGKDAVTYWGQNTTVIYQFDLFDISNKKVNELMEDFECFVFEASQMLYSCGVDKFVFVEQLKDYSLPVPKDIPCRSLRYMATFSAMYPIHTTRIRQILLSFVMGGGKGSSTIIRGSGDSDTITDDADNIIKPDWLVAVSENFVLAEPTYVAGVDYELTEDDDGRAVISWVTAGRKPETGSRYCVHYVIYDTSTITI